MEDKIILRYYFTLLFIKIKIPFFILYFFYVNVIMATFINMDIDHTPFLLLRINENNCIKIIYYYKIYNDHLTYILTDNEPPSFFILYFLSLIIVSPLLRFLFNLR